MRRPLGHLCAGGWGRSGKLAAQRLPSGEALMGRMPEADSLLTQLPTEKHLVSLPEGGKVDEPGVQVLHQTTKPLDLLDPLSKLQGHRLQLLFQLGKEPALSRGAIASDMGAKFLHLVLLRAHLATDGDELFEDRLQAREELVGFFEGEVFLGHSALRWGGGWEGFGSRGGPRRAASQAEPAYDSSLRNASDFGMRKELCGVRRARCELFIGGDCRARL